MPMGIYMHAHARVVKYNFDINMLMHAIGSGILFV